MGIFGAGNAGASLTKFVAPTLVVAYGWQMVPKVYAIAMLITVLLFWMFSYTEESHQVGRSITLKDQITALKDPRVWKYCQYYSIVFGGYVALSLWMTKYYIQEYGFDIQRAALIAAVFVLPSGVIRAAGGWLSDKFGAPSVPPFSGSNPIAPTKNHLIVIPPQAHAGRRTPRPAFRRKAADLP